jgi:hypothetical protein
MKNGTAETANNTAEENTARTPSGENSAQNIGLDHRFRQIGIPAVIAAARYHGVAKNPAYAPAPSHWNGPAGETA